MKHATVPTQRLTGHPARLDSCLHQSRSAERAIEQALGSLLALGRRTLSRSLWALGRQNQDWSADYKLHSRASWKAQDLFQPILERASRFCDDSLLVVAMDDTVSVRRAAKS